MPDLSDSYESRRRALSAPAHNEARFFTPEQKRRKTIESSARWQRLRRWFFVRNPLCADPFKVNPFPSMAEEIHHIVPVAKNPDLAFDPENLGAVCRSCHRRVDEMEADGKETAHLFPVPCVDSDL